jgi:SAM-dependent methyltransferase
MVLPLTSGHFDAALAPMSLMLFDSPEHALDEIARVLKPGGVFGALLPTRWPITAQDLPVLVALGLALRTRPEFPQRIEGRRLAAALKQAGLRVTSDQRLRFELPVSSEADAREVVESLYLPGVPEVRRQAAVQTLAAREGRVWVPVPLRRVVASKPRI